MVRRRPTYSVYVVELAPSSAESDRAELYVGSTALPPEERVARHAGVVRRRFRRLRPDLAAGVGPFPDRPSAHRAELALRRRLERRGYRVRGACSRGCAL